MGNSQSRKWNITINNPETVGLNHKAIVEKLKLFCPRYYVRGVKLLLAINPHAQLVKAMVGHGNSVPISGDGIGPLALAVGKYEVHLFLLLMAGYLAENG